MYGILIIYLLFHNLYIGYFGIFLVISVNLRLFRYCIISTVSPSFWQRWYGFFFFGYYNIQNRRYLNHFFEIKIHINSYNSLFVELNIWGFKICKPTLNPHVFFCFFVCLFFFNFLLVL